MCASRFPATPRKLRRCLHPSSCQASRRAPTLTCECRRNTLRPLQENARRDWCVMCVSRRPIPQGPGTNIVGLRRLHSTAEMRSVCVRRLTESECLEPCHLSPPGCTRCCLKVFHHKLRRCSPRSRGPPNALRERGGLDSHQNARTGQRGAGCCCQQVESGCHCRVSRMGKLMLSRRSGARRRSRNHGNVGGAERQHSTRSEFGQRADRGTQRLSKCTTGPCHCRSHLRLERSAQAQHSTAVSIKDRVGQPRP